MDIFVGSLPFKYTEKDLIGIFEVYGKVSSATIVIDKRTRQNKGFGFVEMPIAKEAMKAIKALDGSDQLGRAIIVSEAQKTKKEKGLIRPPKTGLRKVRKKILSSLSATKNEI
ncbi:MAG: RNA-binding protein [Cytophagaceae bacterium]|nr:RNA-binding protein [Cytophagaceae bacterium]